MDIDLTAHLKTLSEAPGPSGYEGPVRAVIRDAWGARVDDLHTDGLGSLIAVKHGTGPAPRRKIMLSAHMDEIGLIVAEIRDGFIRSSTLGGVDYRALLMQPVLVHGKRTLPGVFGAAPPHMSRSRKKYPDRYDLWIDVGLPAGEVEALVQIGDVITFDAPLVELQGERVTGKAFDNRISVAAVTLCLDELARRDHAWDVIAVATTQEERGAYGATTATYQVAPDIAVAIDGTFGQQTGAGEDESFTLGEGPTLGVGPNFHPLLVKTMRDTAKSLEITLHDELLPGSSGTDAWVIQLSREGVPSLLLSIPMKNMHTPAEIVDLRDIRRVGRLLAAFIAGLEPDFLETIAWPTNDKEHTA
jgi:tetrahedral aminopeptidase